MYWFSQIVACTVIAAVAGNAEIINKTISTTFDAEMTVDDGSDFAMYIMTMTDEVSACYIITPTLEIIEFIPENRTVLNPKYELMDNPRIYTNPLIGCGVMIHQVHEDDTGFWYIHSVSKDGVERSHSYNITVKPEKEDDRMLSINVDHRGDSVLLSCLAPSHNGHQPCNFKAPSGETLRVTEDFVYGRYRYFADSIQAPGPYCGLNITKPVQSDLGQWRCTIDVAGETYYAYLTVTSDIVEDNSALFQLWVAIPVIIVVGLCLFISAMLIGRRIHREYTYTRAPSV